MGKIIKLLLGRKGEMKVYSNCGITVASNIMLLQFLNSASELTLNRIIVNIALNTFSQKPEKFD